MTSMKKKIHRGLNYKGRVIQKAIKFLLFIEWITLIGCFGLWELDIASWNQCCNGFVIVAIITLITYIINDFINQL